MSRYKLLLIFGFIGASLLVLPFSYNSYTYVRDQAFTPPSSASLLAQVQGSAAGQSFTQILDLVVAQVDGVLAFTAQAIQAVTDAPNQFFDIASNDPPLSQADVQNLDPTINADTGLPFVPAPQVYEGTLVINVPLQVSEQLSVAGATEVADLFVSGSFSITDLAVPGQGTIGTLVAGGTQLGALTVSGNTSLNTLSVSGPVSFNTLTAGTLTVTNSLLAQGGVTTAGADIDLEGGNIFAANVINELVAGDNIEITGTPNAPVISADVPRVSLGSRVRSLNGINGSLTLVDGGDISIGVGGGNITLTNTSNLNTVTGRGGCVDCILDVDVVDALTIASGTINNTVIGATTPAAATFTTVTVTDTATSTFGGSIDVTSGCVAINGVCLGGGVAQLNDLLDVTLTTPTTSEVLLFNGSQWINSSLTGAGLGDGSYLGLSDTPATFVIGAVPFVNASGTALTQSTGFTFDGTQVAIGSTTPVTTLTIAGDASVLGQAGVRWYDNSSTNYVGFRASTTLGSSITWTLPVTDGGANEFIVTDGAGNLRFADASVLGAVTELDDLDDVSLSSTSTGDVLVFNGSSWVNQATSTLGLGDGSYLGLSDTPSSYTATAIVFANSAGTGLTQDVNFTYDGGLAIGTPTAIDILTVDGDIGILNQQNLHLYDADSSNYVGLRASSTVSVDTIWTLPAGDGLNNQVLVTDGVGNLRFESVSAIGGGATTFLGLTDTPGSYVANAIPFASSTSGALLFSNNLVYNGDSGFLGLGTNAPTDRLTVLGSVFIGLDPSTPGISYNQLDNQVSIGTELSEEKLMVSQGSILQRGGSSTEPYQPTLVGSESLIDAAYAVDLQGNYAYVVSRFNGNDFHVIDLEDKANPVEVGFVNLSDTGRQVSVRGDYAYVVSDVGGSDFHVIDISNPASPSEVAFLGLGTSATGLAIQGRYAYVGTGNAVGVDFYVIDIINPLAPRIVGSIDVGADINSIALSGNNAYVVTDTPATLVVISVSDPALPSVVSSSTLPADASDIKIRGNYAYIATYSVGDDFHIYNIANPASPSPVSSLGLTSGANGLDISGRYAYVTTAGTLEDLHVIDIYDPDNPVQVGSVETNAGSAFGIKVRGRYAYLTSSATADEFYIFDVTGVEAQSMLAHSLESGDMSVIGNIVAAGDLSLSGALDVGLGGLRSDGSLLIQGSGTSVISGAVAIGTSTAPQDLTIDGDVLVTGQLFDSSYVAGTYGQLLMANGVGQVWTATSSLGLSEVFTSSAELAALIGDETGTAGSLVFSVSPNFSGTVNVSAITASSAVTLSGTAANIALGSNYLSGDGDDEGIFVTSGGSVGIATSSPASTLSVEGTIMASNLYGTPTSLSTDAQGNIIRTPSDERLKTNIQPLENALDTILALRGVRYDWIDTSRFGTQTEVGFIAQEVDLVLPEVVRKGGEYWSLNVQNMVAVIVTAMQEMWVSINGQQEKIEVLEDRVQYLESLLQVDTTSVSAEAEDGDVDSESNADTNPADQNASEEGVGEQTEANADVSAASSSDATTQSESEDSLPTENDEEAAGVAEDGAAVEEPETTVEEVEEMSAPDTSAAVTDNSAAEPATDAAPPPSAENVTNQG